MPTYQTPPCNERSAWTDGRSTCNGPLAKATGNNAIALILGNMPTSNSPLAPNKRALQGRELVISTDLRETVDVDSFWLRHKGCTHTTFALTAKLALREPLTGWILLDPKLNLV